MILACLISCGFIFSLRYLITVGYFYHHILYRNIVLQLLFQCTTCLIDGESEGVPANYRDEDNPSTDDLLYISGEMIGFSLSVIGACLVLPPADIEDTKSRDFKSDRDKIHRLLVKWKEANRGKCSWTDLTKCLQGLNNTTLMDSLNSYLKNKQGN